MAPQLLPPAKKKIGAESGSMIKASTFIPEKKKKIKSSDIVEAKPTSIVKQDKSSSAIVKQFGSANKSLVKITNLVQTDLKEDTKKYKKEKEEKAKEKDKKKKEDIERRLESGLGLKIPNIGGLKLPGIKAPGFFKRIFDALLWLGLGWIVDKLLDKESWFNKIGQALLSLGKFLDENLPKVVEGIFGFAQKAFPFVTGAGKLLFDSLASMLDAVVKPYDQLKSFTREKYGEKGLEQLDGFLSKFDKFIDGLLIFGTAWTLLDDGKKQPKLLKDKKDKLGKLLDSPKGSKLASGITPPAKPSDISAYLSKDPRSLSTRKKFGPTSQKIFDNSFSNALLNGKTKTQARRTADAAVQRAIKSGRITPEKLIGLAGPGQKAGKVLKYGIGRSVKRFAIQKLGKAGSQKAASSFAKGLFKNAVNKIGAGKIPIIGPLFVALASFLDGDPPGKTLFKTFGSGLGQALGGLLGGIGGAGVASAPLAFVGSIAGGFVGEFLGGALYELMFGNGISALKGYALNASKSVVRNLIRTPKLIVDGVMGLWAQLKNVPQLVIDGVTKLIETIGNVSKFVGDLITNIWNKISNFDYFGFISGGINWLVNKGKIVWDSLVKIVTPSIQKLLGKAGEIYSTILSKAQSYLRNPLLIFKDLYDFNVKSYQKLWEVTRSIFDFAKEKLSSIDWKKLAFDSLTYIGNLVGNVGNFMRDMMNKIGEYALNIGKQALDVLNVVIDKGKDILSYLTDQVTRALSKAVKLLYKIIFPHALWKPLVSFTKSISGGLKNFVNAIDNIPLLPDWVKRFARSTVVTIENISNSIATIEPFKNLNESFNALKKEVGDIFKNINLGKMYQDTMKSVFEFADFKDPKEEASLKKFYGVENKNKGGIVGLNDGGIAMSGGDPNFNVSGKGWGVNASVQGGATSSAFAIPYDTPKTKSYPGLTQKRFMEAESGGYTLPTFATGGVQGLRGGGGVTKEANMGGIVGGDTSINSAALNIGTTFGGAQGTKQNKWIEAMISGSNNKNQMGGSAKITKGSIKSQPQSPESVVNASLFNLQAATPTIAPDGRPYYGPFIQPIINKQDDKEGIFTEVKFFLSGLFSSAQGSNDPETPEQRFKPSGISRLPSDKRNVPRNNNIVLKKDRKNGLESVRPSESSTPSTNFVSPQARERTEQTFNKGGMVSNIVGSITPKPSIPTSSIKPSIEVKKSLIPSPSKSGKLASPSMSPRYDVNKFNRSLDYEDSQQVIERAVVILKPVVIR